MRENNSVLQGAVVSRVARVMIELLNKKEGKNNFTNKPYKIVKEYIEVFKLNINTSHKKFIKEFCIREFLDPKSKFYHCGSKGNLNKIINSLNNSIVPGSPDIIIDGYFNEDKLNHKNKYRRYLKSDKWRNFKKELINTRGHKCEKCNEKYKPLDGHHLTYERLFNELPEDVMLLCRVCHKKEHKYIKN